MFLCYEGKKSVERILIESKSKLSECIELQQNVIYKGDNFEVMSSLINSGYGNSIDLIYIDPPFSTNIDFIVSSGRNNTISSSKNGIVAYSDKLKGSDYIEFLRERIVLMRELLSESGSIYLHIDYKIGHYVKVAMDEIFGEDNFINDITRIKSNPKNFSRKAYGNQKDLILFYAKNKGKHIFNEIKVPLSKEEVEHMFKKKDDDGRFYNTVPVHAPGETSNGPTGGLWRGMYPPPGRHWRTSPEELDKLEEAGQIEWSKNNVPRIKKFADSHTGKKMQDFWLGYKDPQYPDYPTQKNIEMLEMIVEQSSSPSSIVLDCFAGSGNTLLAAFNKGRRYIGIDQSDQSINVMSERLPLATVVDFKTTNKKNPL